VCGATLVRVRVLVGGVCVRVPGKLKPNLGRHDAQPEWGEILKHYRGSELQNYFTMVRAPSQCRPPPPRSVLPRSASALACDPTPAQPHRL
jgi:hypothetical protein